MHKTNQDCVSICSSHSRTAHVALYTPAASDYLPLFVLGQTSKL